MCQQMQNYELNLHYKWKILKLSSHLQSLWGPSQGLLKWDVKMTFIFDLSHAGAAESTFKCIRATCTVFAIKFLKRKNCQLRSCFHRLQLNPKSTRTVMHGPWAESGLNGERMQSDSWRNCLDRVSGKCWLNKWGGM